MWPTVGSRAACVNRSSRSSIRFPWRYKAQRDNLLRNRQEETGRNDMKYSLSEAAKATGKNKTTIQRAIKSGKISASKGDSGAYEIDPSELHRIFPPAAAQHHQSNDTQQGKIASNNSALDRVVKLEKELAVIHERANGLEAQKDQMADTISDLRKRLDSSEGRITALLTDNRPKRISWWPWKRT